MDEARKPNVVLINCDDLGYGDLGCYGSKANDTPFIDSLAENGVRFTSFYASSPVCSPSRASLMTGCYPPRVGITRVLFPGEPDGLNPGEYTLPQMFKDAGYATMIVGKWHCGDQPESLPCRFGFDDYYGLPYSNDMGMQAGRPDHAKYPPLPLVHGDEVIQEQPDQCGLTERYTEQCINFIRNNSEKPFFLYIAHMHVHLPLYAAHHFVTASRNGDFGACMSETDWSTAAVADELKRLGIYENTIIIFTSDNGSRADHGASNAPLRGAKQSVWEGGMRVPFIFHWKGHVREGAVVDSIAANLDLLPSLASLLGLLLRGNTIDGIDISPLLLGRDLPVRENFCYFQHQNLAAVRHGRWKLHRSRGKTEVRELYDLNDDMGETNDLITSRPDIADSLEKLAQSYAEKLGDGIRGISGGERRPCLTAESPKPLTEYDEDHPYIVALYDKTDCG